LSIVFITLLSSQTIQRVFAELIRPIAMDRLKKALADNLANNSKDNLVACCNLIILYEAAGLSKQASKNLKEIKAKHGQTLLVRFVEAYLSYRKRNYKRSLRLFLALADSDFPLGNELKSMFLAAAACSAHAGRDFATTLNLVDRALEFDYNCAIARMIKIDIYLKQGKEEKAANEFQTSLLVGLDQSIDQQLPIDWQKALSLICHVDTCNEQNSDIPKSANQGPSPF
jgi:tetratricopeptide (TPR) repeat protein